MIKIYDALTDEYREANQTDIDILTTIKFGYGEIIGKVRKALDDNPDCQFAKDVTEIHEEVRQRISEIK